MSELSKNIFDIKNSKSYIDYNRYHKDNVLGITKVSRWELTHSNFLAWILNPSGSHMLHTFPLRQFILSLEFLKDKPDNNSSRIDLKIIRKFYDNDFIVSAEVEREVEHIDIHMLVRTKEKTLPILIENKVDSKENGKKKDQTNEYFAWGEKTYSDKKKYYDPIYVFLLPEYNIKVKQKNGNYMRMTYQELVNYVLEPSYFLCSDSEAKNNIKIYLQCLSYQDDNEKGDRSMAISSEERKIIDDFIKENKNLLCSVLNELKDDVDASVLDKVTSTVRDYTTYLFEGKVYTKNKLVLAVVSKYVADKKPASFIELEKAFPKKLQGSYGVVRLESKVNEKDKGKGGVKRYFADQPIKLASGEVILVSTQWGRDNIDSFIDAATSYGYSIAKT